jgi:hypothetical protein
LYHAQLFSTITTNYNGELVIVANQRANPKNITVTSGGPSRNEPTRSTHAPTLAYIETD